MDIWKINIDVRNMFRRFIPFRKRQPNRLALHYAVADTVINELYDDYVDFRTLKKFEANIIGQTFALEALLNRIFIDRIIKHPGDIDTSTDIYINEESYTASVDLANYNEKDTYTDDYIDLANYDEKDTYTDDYVDLALVTEGQSFEDFQVVVPKGVNKEEVKNIINRYKPATKEYSVATY